MKKVTKKVCSLALLLSLASINAYAQQLPPPLVTSAPDSNAYMADDMSEAAMVRLWSRSPGADKGVSWRLPQQALDDCMRVSREVVTTSITQTPAARFKSAPGESGLNTLGDPIRFRFRYGNNQFQLSDAEERKLAGVARAMQNPSVLGVRFLLAGFANATNTTQASKKVSCQRAAMVRERLVAQGVAPERLAVFGFGEEPAHFLPGTDGPDPLNRRLDVYQLAR